MTFSYHCEKCSKQMVLFEDILEDDKWKEYAENPLRERVQREMRENEDKGILVLRPGNDYGFKHSLE